jgi:hypothetical protein
MQLVVLPADCILTELVYKFWHMRRCSASASTGSRYVHLWPGRGAQGLWGARTARELLLLLPVFFLYVLLQLLKIIKVCCGSILVRMSWWLL